MSKRLLIALAIGLALAGGYVWYQNGQEAAMQAAAVTSADRVGQDTAPAVQQLRSYVDSHMGAHAEITLATSYAKAQAAARVAAAAQAANSQIYAEAQRVCGGKRDSVTQAKCNQDYLSKHLASMPLPTPVPEPRLADYQLKLSAPWWTPDLAGSLLAGAVVALVLVVWPLVRRRSA